MSKLTIREKQALATMVRQGKKMAIKAVLAVLKDDSRYCPRCGALLSLEDFKGCYCDMCAKAYRKKWEAQFPSKRARSIRK